MKRFKFKMQAVLETREREEELARAALVEVETALDECRTNLNSLVARKIEHHKEMARIGRDVTRTDDINELFQYSQELSFQIDQQNRLLDEAEKRVEQKRTELRHIMQDRKMLESLREKEWQRWRKDNAREEQELLDEIGATSHLRNGERGSAMTNALVVLVVLIIAGAILFGVSQAERWLTAKVESDLGEAPITVEVETAAGEDDEAVTPLPTLRPGTESDGAMAREELNSVASIREARDQLYERETELARWEEELTEQQAELDAYRQDLEADRKVVEDRIAYFEKLKEEIERRERLSIDERIQALAKIYNGMDAPKVAEMMLEMENDRVVAILSQMQSFAAQEVIQSLITKDKQRALAIQEGWVEEQTGS